MTSPEYGRDADDLELRVEGTFQRFLELVDEVRGALGQRSADLLSEVLKQLSSAVEDLDVSTQKMQARNEVLEDDGDGSVSTEVTGAATYGGSGEPRGLRSTRYESRLVLQAALTQERQASNALRKTDAAKDALLLAASHDLSSPVAAVAALADQLVAHPDLPDGELRDMAAGIASAGSQLRSILANLLDTERVLGDHVVAHSQTTDLHDLVVGTVRAHHLPTSCVRPRRGPVLVDVDSGLTARIVDNIVGNALRHTPAGTPISVSLHRQEGEVVLGVVDRGPGVPDELKDEIFDPPLRHGSQAPGLGLGLFIVRRFAELQGGRSWVEDTDGGGATFKVALPAAD
ncbi:MAG TPA: ATP-binding protein [Acidimicrobiales bacterium]